MKRTTVSGLSLVELLVSIALGVVLGLVAALTYVQAKHHFLVQRQVAQVQDSGRHALRLLGRELALSGFFAGLSPSRVALADPPGEGCVEGWALDGAVATSVFDDFLAEAFDDPGLRSCFNADAVVPGTDVLAVKRTAGQASVAGGDIAPGLVASATQRWYLRVSGSGRPAWRKHSASELLALEPAPGVSYWRAMSGVYFVRAWSASDGDGIPTLCVDALAGSVMSVRCLVEGVEDLQLQFGFDTDGDGVADRYGSARSGGSLATAVSARVFLLLRSLDAVHGSTEGAVYTLGDKVRHMPADGHLRQVVSTTVPLDSRPRPLG